MKKTEKALLTAGITHKNFNNMTVFTELNPNPLVQYLNKSAEEFTKADIIKYIEDHNIEMVTFRYTGGDGRL